MGLEDTNGYQYAASDTEDMEKIDFNALTPDLTIPNTMLSAWDGVLRSSTESEAASRSFVPSGGSSQSQGVDNNTSGQYAYGEKTTDDNGNELTWDGSKWVQDKDSSLLGYGKSALNFFDGSKTAQGLLYTGLSGLGAASKDKNAKELLQMQMDFKKEQQAAYSKSITPYGNTLHANGIVASAIRK